MAHNESLPSHLPLSVASFRLKPSHSPHQNLRDVSQRGEGEALIYFFCYSELSDQGAVCLPAHQILGRAETKSKHCEVPFKIHLRNGRTVCHRAVHARVCLCMYVHRPPSSSVVPSTTYLSVPVIMARFYFELSCHCFIIVQPCSWPAVPSKITGWSCGFPDTVSPCTRLCSPHITMETTRFLSLRGSIKHFYFEKLFMCQWKGWRLRWRQRVLCAVNSLRLI